MLEPGQVIVIRDFVKHFTVSQNRRNAGALDWVSVKTKHDGKGFRRLMRHAQGPAYYCAFMLMVQVAAKCADNLGILADEDGPLTFEDLEAKTGCPADVFEDSIEVLCSKGIAWITIADAQDALGARSKALSYETVRDDCLSVCTGEDLKNGKPVDRLSCLAKVEPRHFDQTGAMVQIAGEINRERPGHLPEGDEGVLLVIGACEQARTGKTPAKLFRWIIDTQNWSKIDPPQRRTSERRLREYREIHARAGPHAAGARTPAAARKLKEEALKP